MLWGFACLKLLYLNSPLFKSKPGNEETSNLQIKTKRDYLKDKLLGKSAKTTPDVKPGEWRRATAVV